VLPVLGGKKEFCSEPCLTAYRKAQKAINNSSTNPNPYSLPASTNGTAAARPSSLSSSNSKPALSDTGAHSGSPVSPVKNSGVKKIEAVTPTSSSNGRDNNSAGEQGGSEVKQEEQSPGTSKKIPQNPDQEVSSRNSGLRIRALLRSCTGTVRYRILIWTDYIRL